MNFLAHIYLSGDDELLRVGNFMGDFVKGKYFNQFPPTIQKGIFLHRQIDYFTDRHPVVKQSKTRIWKKYRHYSSVIVDIYYDHFLAKHWKQYSNMDLLPFTYLFYKNALNYQNILPQQALNALYAMQAGNWLYDYRTLEGIHVALTNTGKRTKFDSKMNTASIALQENYKDFETDFFTFFPCLISQVKKITQTLSK